MSSFHLVVKRIAIFLAIVLVLLIISSIVYGISLFFYSFSEDNSVKKDMILKTLEVNNVSTLDIVVNYSDLSILKGEVTTIETNNSDIKYDISSDKLVIRDTKKRFFHRKDTKLIITIGSDFLLNNLKIENGAGFVNISDLTLEKMEMDLGAGRTKISNIEVLNNTSLNSGAGEVVISKTKMNNADLNLGIGSFKFDGVLTGNVNAGVGDVNINLDGELQDYIIDIETGIGSVKVDSKVISKDSILGNGSKKISIEGGIGSVNVNFQK